MPGTAGISLTEFTARAHGERLATYIAALEAFDAVPQLGELKTLAHQRTGISEASSVLDVGCGFGLETLRIARLVSASVTVKGVDLSPDFIAEAGRRASAAGAAIDFRVGSAEALPFADASFDVVRAERVLIYVEDVARAVGEMIRMARPGGWLAMIEPDISTTTVNLTDRALVRRVMGHEAETHVAHGYLPGALAELLRRPGFSDVGLDTRVVVFPPDLARDYLLQCGRSAADAGVLDGDGPGRWADGIAALHAKEQLFCTVGYFLFTARRAAGA